MKCIKLLCFFVFIGMLNSCQSYYTDNKTIKNAEEILYVLPDSAYSLLTSIKYPEKLSKADYAAWCLHYTHARYKLQKEIKSDSLIRVSINYYSKSSLDKYSGTAWYLLGAIYRKQNKNKEAIFALKIAEDILSGTNEYRINGVIAFNIGYICMQDELYNHSLTYFRKSLKYFEQSGDYKYSAYSYREIANMYTQLNYPFDSTYHYLSRAADLSKKVGDSINYYNILITQGKLLLERDAYRSKEYILQGYEHFPDYKPYYAAYLANAYSQLGQQDSSKFYLNISLADTIDSPYKIIGLHAAALIAKSENNYKNAYDYLERSYSQRDITFKQNMRSHLYRIDKQYSLAQKENENAHLKIDNRNKVIWIAILLIFALTVLIVFLLIDNKHKKKHATNEIEKQRFKFEAETNRIKNTQKRELLGVKIQSKIDNTLQFNRFKKSCLQKEKMDSFIQNVAKQSIITEREWSDYVNEVDELFDNRIKKLKEDYKELTIADLIVIVLICLKVSISNGCNLLDMSKNTMYTRRRTIKIRLSIDDDVNLETWLDNYMSTIDPQIRQRSTELTPKSGGALRSSF